MPPHVWTEARITINDIPLTMAQAMTIRVGLNHFISTLEDEGLGDDDHGRIMTERYTTLSHEVLALIHREAR